MVTYLRVSGTSKLHLNTKRLRTCATDRGYKDNYAHVRKLYVLAITYIVGDAIFESAWQGRYAPNFRIIIIREGIDYIFYSA